MVIGGRIDRLDIRATGDAARITDYKSIKPPTKTQRITPGQGCELQRVLYAIAVRALVPEVRSVVARLIYLADEPTTFELKGDDLDDAFTHATDYLSVAMVILRSGRIAPRWEKDAFYDDMRLALPADRESYLRRKASKFRTANQQLNKLWGRLNMTLVDQDSRCRAMTDFASILLVEAAAATGKTSLMAGRVAMMLAARHRLGEIAAITFTELAASQLASRIKETIDVLLAGEVPASLKAVISLGLSEQQRSALAIASTQLDELTATTIHGFCQAIIRSHGVQAGLDPGARIADATIADNLFRAELSAWFTRRLSIDASEDDPIVVLAEQIPLQVVDLIRELAGLRRKHPDAQPIALPVTCGQISTSSRRWMTSNDGEQM